MMDGLSQIMGSDSETSNLQKQFGPLLVLTGRKGWYLFAVPA